MLKCINKKRNKKGFTLIELVVVIAILAILAMIAVPRFSDQTEKAKISADQATARTIISALNMAISSGDASVNYTDKKITMKTNAAGTVVNTNLTELTDLSNAVPGLKTLGYLDTIKAPQTNPASDQKFTIVFNSTTNDLNITNGATTPRVLYPPVD